jgi:hypothetical protein
VLAIVLGVQFDNTRAIELLVSQESALFLASGLVIAVEHLRGKVRPRDF